MASSNLGVGRHGGSQRVGTEARLGSSDGNDTCPVGDTQGANGHLVERSGAGKLVSMAQVGRRSRDHSLTRSSRACPRSSATVQTCEDFLARLIAT